MIRKYLDDERNTYYLRMCFVIVKFNTRFLFLVPIQ